MPVLSRTAAWAAAPLLALALYWPGLVCWFQKDDFAWLGLRAMVHNAVDLRWALFAPLAQGTIRPISERLVYLSFSSLFGMHPLPYRILAFLTFFAALTMLALVAARLTGSRAAGFWAGMIWTINGALSVALSWTPIYYEILISLVFLVCLWFLIRYDETGLRRFYIAQWAVFLLGFGVLELNVVYPALALAYALCRVRHLVKPVLPLFAASALYTVAHTAVAPLPATGVYRLHWDARVVSTLWTYLKWSVGPSRLILIGVYPSRSRSLLTGLLLAGMLVFLIAKLRKREWIAAFFPAWFLMTLAPVLPLRDHMMDYYLTAPLIGLSMWGGWASVCAWRSGIAAKAAAAVLLLIYAGASIPVGRATAVSFYDRSQRIRGVLEGVAAQHRAHPGKTILLAGVDPDMFWSAIFHRPFRLYGVTDIYLMPEERSTAGAGELPPEPDVFFIKSEERRNVLAQDSALVLNIAGGHVEDVTNAYRLSIKNESQSGEGATRFPVIRPKF